MKYFFLLVFTVLLSACHSVDSESVPWIGNSVYPANTDCLKLRVTSAFFDDYDEIEILGYIENISEEKFACLYFADDYLCWLEHKQNKADEQGLIQLWWEDFLFVKNNGRWEACWDFPLETSQFRFYSVVIQPCARLRFRIRRSPVNGV